MRDPTSEPQAPPLLSSRETSAGWTSRRRPSSSRRSWHCVPGSREHRLFNLGIDSKARGWGNRRAWVHPDQAKARKAIPVPLNDDAMKVLGRQVGKHRDLVFSFRGRQVLQVSTKAWYAALERTGIADFRWHDLRHTWASWHVQGGTPLFALQELGGWGAGSRPRWCGSMRTWRLIIWHRGPTDWHVASSMAQSPTPSTAQIWHKGRFERKTA
jgi:hypothetical protein